MGDLVGVLIGNSLAIYHMVDCEPLNIDMIERILHTVPVTQSLCPKKGSNGGEESATMFIEVIRWMGVVGWNPLIKLGGYAGSIL